MILVVGATGTTGSAVVRELLARGAEVRGLTSSPEKAAGLEALGAEAVVGDLARPASLAPALRGVERMYVALPASREQAVLEGNAYAAAEQAGVYHVVKLGVIGQSPDVPLLFGRLHAEAFEALRQSSLRWTLLQPNGFMQNYLAASPGVTPRPDGPVSHVDARDIAEVAARALTEDGHESCSYVLTGPEAVTDAQIAGIVADVTGRDVPVVGITDGQFADALRGFGMEDWYVEALVELAAFYRTGGAAGVAPDAAAVLGREPRSFRQFAEDHRDALAQIAAAP